MKKYIGVFAVILSLAVLLSGCVGGDGGEDGTESGTEGVSEESTPPSSDTVTDTEKETATVTQTLPVTDKPAETSVITETETEDAQKDPIDTNNGIVQTAETLVGIPFAENGADPSEGFDNSGFIYYVLRENGFINCPRLTKDQAAMGTHIGYEELKSGDLAFFCTADSGNPDFGGIYIGEGQMIYSPMPGQTVKITDITSDYWKGTFVAGIRLS